MPSVSDFLQRQWGREPILVPDRHAAFGPQLADPTLASAAGVVAAHSGPVLLSRLGPRGVFEEATFEPERWEAQLDEGFSIGLVDVQTWLAVARDWCARLVDELGLPRGAARAIVFISGDGCGRPKHIDSREVFVIQLYGAKRWVIAPNREVAHASEAYHPPQEPHPDLLRCGMRKSDLSWPGEAREVVLRPGTALYMPRGYWHSTEAIGRSISLSIGLERVMWLDLLPEAWRSRLIADERWRASAFGGRATGGLRKLAEETLSRLLADLGSRPEATAAELLDGLATWSREALLEHSRYSARDEGWSLPAEAASPEQGVRQWVDSRWAPPLVSAVTRAGFVASERPPEFGTFHLAGLTVRDDPDALQLHFADDLGHSVAVALSARDDDTPRFDATRLFNLSYGDGATAPDVAAALTADVVRRLREAEG